MCRKVTSSCRSRRNRFYISSIETEGQRSSLWYGQREGSVSMLHRKWQQSTFLGFFVSWRVLAEPSFGEFGDTSQSPVAASKIHSWPIRGHLSMQQHWKRLSSPPQRGRLPKTGQFLELGQRKWPRGVSRLDDMFIDSCDKTAYCFHSLGVCRCDKAIYCGKNK